MRGLPAFRAARPPELQKWDVSLAQGWPVWVLMPRIVVTSGQPRASLNQFSCLSIGVRTVSTHQPSRPTFERAGSPSGDARSLRDLLSLTSQLTFLPCAACPVIASVAGITASMCSI